MRRTKPRREEAVVAGTKRGGCEAGGDRNDLRQLGKKWADREG
jgi:hypothetical protein